MKKRYTAGADADANAPLLAGCVCVSPARAMVEMEVNQGKASFIDNREFGGNLWVIGGHELDAMMREMQSRGYHFYFKAEGGKATKGEPAWFMIKS